MQTLPLPAPGTTLRVAARAIAGGEKGPRTLTQSLVAQPPLDAPRELSAVLAADGVALSWHGVRPKAVARPAHAAARAARVPGGPRPPGPGPRHPAPPVRPPAAPAPRARAAACARTASGRRSAGGRRARRRGRAGAARPAAQRLLRLPPHRRATPSASRSAASRSPRATSSTPGLPWGRPPATWSGRWPRPTRSSRARPRTRPASRVATSSPPAAPAGVAVLPREGGLEVLWSPSADADLAGYRVYRTAPGAAARADRRGRRRTARPGSTRRRGRGPPTPTRWPPSTRPATRALPPSRSRRASRERRT